ncbi:MAG TPA: hypothetical protein VF516_08785 [Kofleriaceae bacterium]
MRAIPGGDRNYIGGALRPTFLDSLHLDEATRPQHPGDARWDYLLGHDGTSQIIAVEVHSANTSNAAEVVRKRVASGDHLKRHLQPGETVAAWYWVASGHVDFVPYERTIRYLDQNGIQFVGSRLETKHLASLSRRAVAPAHRRKKPRK